MSKDKDKIIIEVDEAEFEQEKPEEETVRLLGFSLGRENYCVDILQAKEVIKIPQVTKLPNVPEFIAGIMNLRGEIISLINISYFFGLEQQEKSPEKRAIITDVTGSSIGVVVDRVEGTIDISQDSIQPPLATLQGKLVEYTKGQVEIDNRILILLNFKKILGCEEIENLRKGGKQ